MSIIHLVTLMPFTILAATAVILMLIVALGRNHSFTARLTLLGLALSFISLFISASTGIHRITPLLIIDHYALFYIGLIIAASFAVVSISYRYLEGRHGVYEEFYILLLLATFGAAILVASSHYASFFLGLEILSVSLYALIAYMPAVQHDVEAGIKYLILAGVSAAFLLFGMAMIYSQLGTMDFMQMQHLLQVSNTGIFILNGVVGRISGVIILNGIGLIIVGIGFKLAVVPFHLWTPDVYQGAPAPVTAFVATVSKGAVFALLLRYFTIIEVHNDHTLMLIFTLIAIASMVVGNLLALLQNNVKRILAYSSIAHLGYLLVAFLASGTLAITAVTFYLVAYFVTTLGAFGIITVVSGKDRDADSINDYQGLFWRHPWLAGSFAAMVLSLAGIPLTAGFIGKFYLVAAGIHSTLWLLVLVLVITSVIGLFYYLRILVALFSNKPPEKVSEITPAILEPISISIGNRLVLGILTILLVWLGIYPVPLIRLIQTMVSGLG